MKDKEYSEFSINPKDISKVIGNGKRNIKRLSDKNKRIKLIYDDSIEIGEILPLKGWNLIVLKEDYYAGI